MKFLLSLSFLAMASAISPADYMNRYDSEGGFLGDVYTDTLTGEKVLCCYDPDKNDPNAVDYQEDPYNDVDQFLYPGVDGETDIGPWNVRRMRMLQFGEDLSANSQRVCDWCCNYSGTSIRYGVRCGDPQHGPARLKSCASNRASGCGGEPHFKTWADKWYDYHGECDLVLMSVPDFAKALGLDVHIRTKIRYDYSYIASAALRIGEDVLEVSSFGDYMVNGVSGAEMPNVLSTMYPVTYTMIDEKQHIFNVQLNEFMTVSIKTFKDFVSVKFQGGDFEVFRNSVGMLGNRTTGEMLARDGETVIEDPNEFGQEWQVRSNEAKLFNHVERYPQHPAQCILPDPNAKEVRRRLGETVSKEAAEKACAHWEEDHREHCVFDVMATGDLEMAEANGAF